MSEWDMNWTGEALLNLVIEPAGEQYMVSCKEFPYLSLKMQNPSIVEVERVVLPVLKEMVEARVGEPISLRLVREFEDNDDRMPPPHVIATRAAHHVTN